MKSKGMIIALIILLSVLIFFLVMFLVICLRGGMSFTNFMGNKNTKVIFDKTYEIENIEDIEINQDAGNITFKETQSANIQVVIYGENENDVTVELNNNKLSIEHKVKTRFISFGFRTSDIIVYVPSNYGKQIKIKNNFGNSEILDLENATIDAKCSAGNITLGKIKNATIECNYGNIEIKEVLNKCDIKADCGDIKIGRMLIKEDSDIRVDLGNINIDETNDIYIETKVDLGEVNVNKNNRNSDITLKIKCDCGDINVEN